VSSRGRPALGARLGGGRGGGVEVALILGGGVAAGGAVDGDRGPAVAVLVAVDQERGVVALDAFAVVAVSRLVQATRAPTASGTKEVSGPMMAWRQR